MCHVGDGDSAVSGREAAGRRMRERIARFATGRPRAVMLIAAVLTVAAGALIARIQIDTDPENMLPADQPDRVFHNLVEERFGLHDAIVVGIVNDSHPDGIYNPRSLEALHRLTERVLAIDGVVTPDLMSLAVSDNIVQERPGEIRFTWMMKEPPADREAAAAIRRHVERLPLLRGTLVSEDGRAAALYVPIESKDLSYPISMEIRAVADELAATIGSEDEYHITGLPVAEDTFGVEMFRQMAISAPLAGLMIFLLMWYFFRSARLVLAPMIVAVVTVVVTMGLLTGLGFTVHIMSSMIPIFLMPIAVVDSVHIMSEFADRYEPGEDLRKIVGRVIDHLYTPMLFTSVTTAVGFASLLLTPIPPVQVFGAFVAFGVLFAFLVTIVFIPAYVVRMSPRSFDALARAKARRGSDTALGRAVRGLGRFAFSRGALVTGAAAAVLAVSVAGIVRIEINDNPVRWFKESHRIRVADEVLNRHFAGTYDAFLVLEHEAGPDVAGFRERAGALLDAAAAAGADVAALRETVQREADAPGEYLGDVILETGDLLFASGAAAGPLERLLGLAEEMQSAGKYFQRPEALALVESLQRALVETGDVGKTNALPDVVKAVRRELVSGEPEDYRIPSTVPAVAQTLMQFQSSHRPQDLWHMVTPDYRSSAIWLQLESGDNQDMTRVMAAMDAHLEAEPLPAGVSARWAGKTYINVVWQQEMVAGMLRSLLGAFAVVFLMMALLFRSALLGLIAMVPLTVTILAVYGLIGWVGKDYDMPIAVLSSLTLGLSVDFAIHFIQRMRSSLRRSGSFAEAAREVFEEPARAISRNAIVIALGFTPLFFAPLVPYVTVGAFMAAIMAMSGIATLMLLPALMALGRRYLFRDVEGDTGDGADVAPASAAPSEV